MVPSERTQWLGGSTLAPSKRLCTGEWLQQVTEIPGVSARCFMTTILPTLAGLCDGAGDRVVEELLLDDQARQARAARSALGGASCERLQK
jgi:hypothetical protein